MFEEFEYIESEREPHVSIGGDWISVKKVEVLDFEEDISGRDLVTFLYEGKEHTSYVTMRFAH